ncbi:MAG: hypothetical protein N2036_11870 [Bryobacteraceae bacterium]|nr:hypothetical protein [Bryobacteraceae bacterium]MCX7604763.1 hypothetical protein [Bryobacteraceae bacterium]
MTPARAEADRNRIILHFDTLEDALRLFSPWRGAAPRAQAAQQIHHALSSVGLRLEVRIQGRPVAELGSIAPHGPLFTLLNGVS